MLRLTLRTLLAYLDDTLEPAQARDIGEKVAESEFAQQTVERIKTVTRRRRLTAPPVEADDHSTDPNVIAEYLDNVLPTPEVADVEQAALDSDLKLAELAACHQILTLVLGEPAKVPPTARRRMYRLVKGPEAIPYRQPAAANAPVAGVAAPAAVDEYHDSDEDLLESVLGPRSLLWLVSLLAVAAVLVVAVWLAIPPTPPPPTQGYVAVHVPPAESAPEPVTPAPAKKTENPVEPKEATIPPAAVGPPAEPKTPQPKETEPSPPTKAKVAGPVVKPPDAQRRPVAAYDTPREPLLYLRRDTLSWDRVDPAMARVNSTDTLLALPGFRPELRLETGPRVQLWGNVPEMIPVPVADARVRIYVPAQGLDGDIGLHAGRVYLTAPKAEQPATIRVRFLDEVWDVTLATPDTEVGIDLIGEPAPGPLFNREVPEAPRFLVYLGVVQGRAFVRTGFQTPTELPPGALWKWDSKGGRPGPAPKEDPDAIGGAARWTKAVPDTAPAKDMAAAVADTARQVGMEAGQFTDYFNAVVKDSQEGVSRRVLAAWMLAGVDSISVLIDALEADAAPVRAAAGRALQHWCAEAPDREAQFADILSGKAAYSEMQQALLVALTRAPARPPTDDTITRLFDLLRESKIAVRELAYLQLSRIDPVGAKESGYDAGGDRRAFQAQNWEQAYRKRMKAKK